MSDYAIGSSAPGLSTDVKIEKCFQFVEQLLALNPRFLQENPSLSKRFLSIKTQDKKYIAHEFFNKDWCPVTFAEVAGDLAAAKLSFACSANYVDQMVDINFTLEQKEFLADIKDQLLQESLKDVLLNRQFRGDYWIKGKRALSAFEQRELLSDTRVLLISSPESIILDVNCGLGKAKMNAEVYQQLIELLNNKKIYSLRDLAHQLPNVSGVQLIESLLILIQKGDCVVAQSDGVIDKAKKSTKKINLFLMNKARDNGNVNYLVSPVSGGGIIISRFGQLFLLASLKGLKTAEEKARFVWDILSQKGQKIIKDGACLETNEENYQELLRQVEDFNKYRLPYLVSLGIA